MKELKSGGFLISKIHQLGGRVFTKLMKKYQIEEINKAQGRILFPLWKKDGISINELARETALGKSTLTSMLDRLEEAGHLRREHSRDDRRKILIFLTEKNKALQEKYIQVSKEMIDLYYDGFSDREIEQCEHYLIRLLRNLEKQF